MRTLFVNAPVRNGTRDLRDHPGQAVGIWAAAALNELSGTATAPHLWNTATLAGDLGLQASLDAGEVSRQRFDAQLIAAKYDGWPRPATVTDTDRDVAKAALDMIEAGLACGRLEISEETVPVCRRCRHMTGLSAVCRMCGSAEVHPATGKHLVALQDLRRARAASRVLLSRTGQHGIGLEPIGLTGLVLDPRAGAHATALAVARAVGTRQVVMLVTEGALTNIEVYGGALRHHDGMRLDYLAHGPIHYPRSASRLDPLIAQWFLPLAALSHRQGITTTRIPALLAHLDRAARYAPALPDPEILAKIRHGIARGETHWTMTEQMLGHALAFRRSRRRRST